MTSPSPDVVLETVTTAELDADDARAAEALVRIVFADEWTDHDWVHALGGTHVLVRSGTRLVGHAAAVPRLVEQNGRRWTAGYVEAVAIDPQFRGGGRGRLLLDAVEAQFDIGLLNSLPDAIGFYESRGWVRWHGPLGGIDHPTAAGPLPDGNAVMVLRGDHLDVHGPLLIDHRSGSLW